LSAGLSSPTRCCVLTDPAKSRIRGSIYLDRKTRALYSVDFDDKQFGGYSVSQLEQLIKECQFLDLVERPGLGERVSIGGWKRASDRKPAFDRKNLPGYQPTPTSIEKRAVRGCARLYPPARREGCSLSETLKASPRIVNDYLGLFVSRRAYTIQYGSGDFGSTGPTILWKLRSHT
jgi:hypothetical protein